MMGTCFDILVKPLPIKQQHINSHRSRVIMGTHKKAHFVQELDDFERTQGGGRVGFKGEMTGTLSDAGLGMEIPIDDPS